LVQENTLSSGMRKLLLLIAILYTGCKDKTSTNPASRTEVQKPSGLAVLKQTFRHKIDSLAALARTFTKANGYNQQYVFIADLSLHSGYERFAVVDIKRDSILDAGLVAHGAGGKYWAPKARFSNVPNSLCSSPGKYRIGNKYDGRFGMAYKLHGLDCVPDKMLYPGILCNSEGCPMVSYTFLATLSSYIDKSKKPVLLWIIG
jgi:hypothetical protein